MYYSLIYQRVYVMGETETIVEKSMGKEEGDNKRDRERGKKEERRGRSGMVWCSGFFSPTFLGGEKRERGVVVEEGTTPLNYPSLSL